MTHPKPRRELRAIEEIGMLFGRTGRMVREGIRAAVEAQGENLLHWGLLFCLTKEGALSQQEIAEVVGQHPTGVSRLLDELEAAKMVHRHRDPNDRRKVQVEVTDAGRARVEATHDSVLAALNHALRGLNSDDRVTLCGLLEKIVSAGESEDVPTCGSRRA